MARCGAVKVDGRKCKNRPPAGEDWCFQHPNGRSGYQPKQPKQRRRTAPRPTPQRRAVPSPTPSTAGRQRREARVVARASKAIQLVQGTWTEQVLGQLAAIGGEETAAGLSIRDCADLAAAADRILHSGQARRRVSGLGFLVELFGGPSPEEALAATISGALDLPPGDSDIAAARALQAVGVALCRRAGKPLTQCPCFAGPAGSELESALFMVLRLAFGDWTGLCIPLQPLASP